MRVEWRSSICSCRATRVCGALHGEYEYCCLDHVPWALIIGSQETLRKQEILEAALARPIPKSFEPTLRRFGSGDATFHRPPEVELDLSAPTAEMGFFLLESLGVELTKCSNPKRYADYLANKATRGLSEKMWKEDHFKRYEDTNGVTYMQRVDREIKYVWPEELVATDTMSQKEAEVFFAVKIDSQLLGFFKKEAAI